MTTPISKSMSPQEFLQSLRGKVEGLREPFTWAHITRLCLALAKRDSSYRQEPLLPVLGSELERRVLTKVGAEPIESGFNITQIAEIGSGLREYERDGGAPEQMQDRFLRWIASGEASPVDWTLPLVRDLFAENRLGVGHFDGTQAWPSKTIAPARTSTEPERHWQEELDALVGLEEVKSEVRRLHKYLMVERWHQQDGTPTQRIALHQIFHGNPGTGKTSVARILARIYREFGFLSKGELVETDRAGLVGSVIGATEAKTEEIIRKSRGSVLFIDEAYSLATDSQQDFGQRAIDTLVKAMEDMRGNLVVIVAGYRKEMERFLGANPGLASRFNRNLDFPDYSNEELVEIFRRFAAERRFVMEDEAATRVISALVERRQRLEERFGNARDVRTLWEISLMRQAERIYDQWKARGFSEQTLAKLTKEERLRASQEEINRLQGDDIPDRF
ncbi:AAA family ATPase [Pedosphaera parvula]|uniref:AAA ATPase central domain protein n=1 Tax=Pedosphaera parvula (strain Ellin514) TaxID=320771 RepID=B9XAF6_PEDPL|nr:AAA family ATPase [Pedosphaera parvula]EEF62991.1 AAA ATPase central domain protein [Pedosphaera parvula Ellin514]